MKLIIETTYKLIHNNGSVIQDYPIETDVQVESLGDFESVIDINEQKQGNMERMIARGLIKNDFYKKDDYESGDEGLQDKE